jgi:hypothetical protein
MTDTETLKRYLRRALAVAHAALDDPDPRRAEEARALADDVLSLTARARPAAATLADGHELVALAGRLRTVMAALDAAEADAHSAASAAHGIAPNTNARL